MNPWDRDEVDLMMEDPWEEEQLGPPEEEQPDPPEAGEVEEPTAPIHDTSSAPTDTAAVDLITSGAKSGPSTVSTGSARASASPTTPASLSTSGTDSGAVKTSYNPASDDLNSSLPKFQMRFVFLPSVNIYLMLFV